MTIAKATTMKMQQTSDKVGWMKENMVLDILYIIFFDIRNLSNGKVKFSN